MATEIKVPPLPESVSDAVIAALHKKVGDSVRRDENLVDQIVLRDDRLGNFPPDRLGNLRNGLHTDRYATRFERVSA